MGRRFLESDRVMRFVGLALAFVAVGAAAVALAVGFSARDQANDARRDVETTRTELAHVRDRLGKLAEGADVDQLQACLPEVVENLNAIQAYFDYGGPLRLSNYSRECARLFYGPPQG